MQTAKEQLEIYLGGDMNTCSLTPSAIIDLMQGYAKHALYHASICATAKLVSNNESVWYNDCWAEVDKQSILDLKDKL